jgi:protein required for attachment to host cells
MSLIWIVTADGSKARIFSAETPTGELTEREAFVNPGARVKESVLRSDRPGQAISSTGTSRGAMSEAVEPKEQERIRFARLIADRIEQGRVNNAFQRVVLVASPVFLGLMRDSLGDTMRSQVSLEIDKDYVTLSPKHLRERLPSRI